MPTSVQAVAFSAAQNDASGAFTVTGVFWLTAPANNVVPAPNFKSQVPNVLPGDLAALRSGQTVEAFFRAPGPGSAQPGATYPAATTQAQVDADIQLMITAAQNALNAGNPALSTLVNRAFNGTTWAAYAGSVAPLTVGQAPSVVTPLYFSAAEGQQPNIVSGRAFGYVANATANGSRILATAYSPAAPGAAAQRSLSSSNAADAAAGTGARTVLITYLTTAFVVKTETVTLNGLTAVNTVGTDIAYIESMVVTTCGSGLTNAGTISIFNATAGGGGTLGSIAIGDGQTNWCHHYVPPGKTCYVVAVTVGASLGAGRGFLNRTGDPSQATLPILPVGGNWAYPAGGPNADHEFPVPVGIPGPDRIFLTALPNAAVASNVCVGSFEYLQL